ncbi:hypothetical protein X975_00858, partial [Stegodyphus mimosarum]
MFFIPQTLNMKLLAAAILLSFLGLAIGTYVVPYYPPLASIAAAPYPVVYSYNYGYASPLSAVWPLWYGK